MSDDGYPEYQVRILGRKSGRRRCVDHVALVLSSLGDHQ